MFKIKFLKNDELLGEEVKKGEVKKVSRSIRDKKVSEGAAEDVTQKSEK